MSRRTAPRSIVFAGRRQSRTSLVCAVVLAAAVGLIACRANSDPDPDAGVRPRGAAGSESSRAQARANAAADARAKQEATTPRHPPNDQKTEAAVAVAIWGEECVSRRIEDFTFDGGDPRQVCVQRINDLRAELRLPALARWTAGERCADATAKKAAETGNVHPSLPPECERGGRRAQNTCPGYASIEQTLELCMVQMWCEGPSASGEPEAAHGHYQNMTRDYSEVACGFYENAEGKVWQIQHFR